MTEMEIRKLNAPKLIQLKNDFDLNNWINKNTFRNDSCNQGILVILESDRIPIPMNFEEVHARIIRADCEVGGCIKAINKAIAEVESTSNDYYRPTVHDGMGYFSRGYDGKFTKEGCRYCKYIYTCTNETFMKNSGYIKSQSEIVDVPFSEIYVWGPQVRLYDVNGEMKASSNELDYKIIGRRFCNMNLYYND